MQTSIQRDKTAALGLGRIGIWSGALRNVPAGMAVEAALEIEGLGFPTLWVPGGLDSAVLTLLDQLLEATSRIKFATGILNIWKHEPADLAAWWKCHSPERQARLLLGLGVSHGPFIGDSYQRPLARMTAFLDGLDTASVPRDRLCVAALGPKMLELAAQRTAGAHPYLVSPRHTEFARARMGPEALLAPEQSVILDSNAARARHIARETVKFYASLPNYYNNWRRDGFTEDEIGQQSDRLIDSVMAFGDLDAVAARIEAHLTAGADHVCLQVIGGSMGRDIALERRGWRDLARLL